MASPQVENGFTRIANELLEVVVRAPLDGRELRLVLFVLRKTYGFGKKEDYISLSQFTLHTRIDRSSVCKIIKKLVAYRTLVKKGSIYAINKNYDEWNNGLWELSSGVQDNPASGVYATYKRNITKERINTVANATTTKKNTMKKNRLGSYREDSHGDYEEVIDFESGEEIVEAPKEKKIYDPETTRLAYLNSPHPHQQILSWFYSKKNLWETFKSKGNLAGADYRHAKIAKRLVQHEWTREDILGAYDKMMKNESVKNEWTLETLEKYLTK